MVLADFSPCVHHLFTLLVQVPRMSGKQNKKITIELPTGLYHALRNEAKRQGVDLPEFVRRKVS